MRKEKKTEYIFTEKEMHMIRECLRYCQHRLSTPTAGIWKAISADEKNMLKSIIHNL